MGKKGHEKSVGKGKVLAKDVNITSGTSKLSRQKRNELNQIVDKLLKVSSNFQTVPNAAKEWERHLEIRKLLEQVDQVEQGGGGGGGGGMKVAADAESARAARLQQLLEWMRAQGAEVGAVRPAQFPGCGWGLQAQRDLADGELVVAVPRRLMLTSEQVQHHAVLGSLLVKDAMLQHMPHVALALLLLVEKFSPDSFWEPYIRALPPAYSTVLYFSTQELQELKGSPSFEPALKHCRNIARQYAYFSKLFQNTSDPASELLRDVFTYDEYRWAVSTVMTRHNQIPAPGAPPPTEFCLRAAAPHGGDPLDPPLRAFLRVFAMKREHLQRWLAAGERVQDLLHPDCALDTEVETRAWAFLLGRTQLLLSSYPTTLQEDLALLEGNTLTPCSRLAVTLRASEKILLETARDYAAPRVHP